MKMFATVFVTICVGLSAHGVQATVEDDEVNCQPQHVHLAYGAAADQLSVVWATNGTCSTEVSYSTSPWSHGTTVSGSSHVYTDHNLRGLHNLHKAMLTGLKESTTYFYRPTSNNIGRGPFYFKTPPFSGDWSPELLVIGDLGPHDDLLPVLSEVALTGQYHAALQLGGLTSHFADANGTRGDNLMNALEHIGAFMPFMTSPGHNETADGQHPAYRNRFAMPGSLWPIPKDKLWYSFNLGPVHYISYCTDIFFHGDQTIQNAQYKWLVRDLSEANTAREKQPWIVAFGHHPMYCTGVTGDEDCAKNKSLVRTGLEETLYYYGVDLILQSHSQSYERFNPLFKGVVLSSNYSDPRAPVQITIGAASDTVQAATTAATPTTDSDDGNTTSTTSNATVVSEIEERTAFRMVNGTRPTYGRLHVVNATHAHWELLAGSAEGLRKAGEVLDSFWLVQEQHGKFQLSDLPDDVEQKIDENLVAGGGKPGVLNVHDPERDTKNMLAADDSRRLIIGASFGAFVVLLVIIVVAIKLRRRGQRRVARRWDSMDYKYGKTKLYAPTNDEEDEDDDFKEDNDFEVDIPDGSQTTKLINGK
ncbi:acid phosphatase type 7-like isoform X2 [Littorina saxatilis]|uniref:Purple acid phosphatase n=1 Tax=Littorina saxatilis TaxID=31220 RepID=A0AAN9C158_9CAEN